MPSDDSRRLYRNILIGTCLLVIGNPIVADSLVPALPSIAESFGVSASEAQLLLSAAVLGVAIGQLVLGTLSDAVGRKPVFIGGLIAFIALSAVAAAMPIFEVLLLLRFLQGAAISSGIVLARAVVSDAFVGPRATGAFNVLTATQGMGAMSLPLFGAAMLLLGGWRMNFVGMAIFAAFTLTFVWLKVPETHPKQRRSSIRLGAMLRSIAGLFRNARYWGFGVVAITGHAAALFLMGSLSFITQDILGLTPLGNSLVMTVGMFGMGATGFIYARFGTGLDPARVLWAAQLFSMSINAVFLIIVALGHLTLPVLVIWMFLFMSTNAVFMANGIKLAVGQVDRDFGTATALLGIFQYGVGALLIPLGGVMGVASALPAAIGVLALTVLAAVVRIVVEHLKPA